MVNGPRREMAKRGNLWPQASTNIYHESLTRPLISWGVSAALREGAEECLRKREAKREASGAEIIGGDSEMSLIGIKEMSINIEMKV